jgi:4-hydroxy-tetrahydrodipicolinate reductase
MKTGLCVAGALGRMGSIILGLAHPDIRFKIVSGLERSGHPMIGQPLSQRLPGLSPDVLLYDDPMAALKEAQVLIDFTLPEPTLVHLKAAVATGRGIVIGTTGFDTAGRTAIEEAARKIPIVFSPNMSVGMNLLFALVQEAAGRLGTAYDVEIVEAHHSKKKDAPSGSALRLGESVAKAWKVDLSGVAVNGREGLTGERTVGTIGFHAVRGGDIVGDHTVYFAGPGERLELKHQAHSREAFAQGALRAALFLAEREPGLYSMQDVLKA